MPSNYNPLTSAAGTALQSKEYDLNQIHPNQYDFMQKKSYHAADLTLTGEPRNFL